MFKPRVNSLKRLNMLNRKGAVCLRLHRYVNARGGRPGRIGICSVFGGCFAHRNHTPVAFFATQRACPEHPWPHDDYVHMTTACDWPEHPCPHQHSLLLFFGGGGRGGCGGGWGGGGGGHYVQSIHAGTMITSVLPVRATCQSIHARTMITYMSPVRVIGQSIHGRTMITYMSPVRAIGQSIHARTL